MSIINFCFVLIISRRATWFFINMPVHVCPRKIYICCSCWSIRSNMVSYLFFCCYNSKKGLPGWGCLSIKSFLAVFVLQLGLPGCHWLSMNTNWFEDKKILNKEILVCSWISKELPGCSSLSIDRDLGGVLVFFFNSELPGCSVNAYNDLLTAILFFVCQ